MSDEQPIAPVLTAAVLNSDLEWVAGPNSFEMNAT
jgi:hypothetical protein